MGRLRSGNRFFRVVEKKQVLVTITLLVVAEIEEFCGSHWQCPEQRIAQKRLAAEITRVVHGEVGLQKVFQACAVLCGGDLNSLTLLEFNQVFADVPSLSIPTGQFSEGILACDLFCQCGLTLSRAKARRKIKQRWGYCNNERLVDERYIFSSVICCTTPYLS